MKRGRWMFLALLLLIPSVGHGQSVNIDLGASGQAGATARLVQLTACLMTFRGFGENSSPSAGGHPPMVKGDGSRKCRSRGPN
jgi:hypothetical protein